MRIPSKQDVKDFIDRNQAELTMGSLYVLGTTILSVAVYKATKNSDSVDRNETSVIPLPNGDLALHLFNNDWFTFRPTPIEKDEE